jgi:hypothetical protein
MVIAFEDCWEPCSSLLPSLAWIQDLFYTVVNMVWLAQKKKNRSIFALICVYEIDSIQSPWFFMVMLFEEEILDCSRTMALRAEVTRLIKKEHVQALVIELYLGLCLSSVCDWCIRARSHLYRAQDGLISCTQIHVLGHLDASFAGCWFGWKVTRLTKSIYKPWWSNRSLVCFVIGLWSMHFKLGSIFVEQKKGRSRTQIHVRGI